jgi:eukaryotic-like serine/threonine-protein kinase
MTGETILYYSIQEKLGEGGMGVVYRARDERLGRDVAIKFLPAGMGNTDDERKRFIHEAKAASVLDHPNICTIYSIDETPDGRLFIVMAYYDGIPLNRNIGQSPMPLRDILKTGLQIASGLQKAHSCNIIHRDLKPANILITGGNQVKIIDFGLARVAEQSQLTSPGTTLGTVPYMSPEQAQGNQVDHRTDIWALGVILYEMVTGLRPFRSVYETALVYSILNENPEPVTSLRSGIPMDLERIIRKCLEKDPHERYQHTDEIIVDLRKVERDFLTGSDAFVSGPHTDRQAAHLPHTHQQNTPDQDVRTTENASSAVHQSDPSNSDSPDQDTSIAGESLSDPVVTRSVGSNADRSNTKVWWLSAPVILVIVIASAYYLGGSMAGEPAFRNKVSLSQVTIDTGVDEYPTWSPDGSRIAFSRDVSGYRNLFIRNLENGQERQLTFEQADNTQPAWSPDGRQLLFVKANNEYRKLDLSDLYGYNSFGDIWSLDLETMTQTRLIEDAYNPAWSPDGRWIAFDASWAGPRRIWLVDERGRNPRQISSDISEAVNHVAPKWSPDGSRIVFMHMEGTTRNIRVLDQQREEIILLTDDLFLNVNPAWSPDGDYIYFSSYRGGGMNIWRASIGSDGSVPREFDQITTGAGQDLNISVSPDGQQLAFTVLGINSDIWSLPVSAENGMPAGEPQPLIMTNREESRGAWSPDGKTIAFNSDRGGDMNIWLYNRDDRSVQRLTHGTGGDYQPNWSPDGRWITFFSSRSGPIDIWKVEVASGTLRQLTNRPASDINPFYSPDGQLIAFHSDHNGRSELWVMNQDGNDLRRLSGMPVIGHFMRWINEGETVVFASGEAGRRGLWKAPLSGRDPSLLVEPRGGGHISFSPDYNWIMDTSDHKALWVTPLDGRSPYNVFEFDDPDVRIDYPVLSPDGRFVLFDLFRPAGGTIWLADFSR